MLECLKLNNSRISQNPIPIIDVVHVTKPLSPLVKYKPIINVIDTENENVCMCALYASMDNVLLANDKQLSMVVGTICTDCQNTIKQQPTEHRKTLISKRLTLANDIIVNRVDTHYLNLNTFPCKYQDPYTPESVESHSPLPELVDFDEPDINIEINQNTIDIDSKINCGGSVDNNIDIDSIIINVTDAATTVATTTTTTTTTSNNNQTSSRGVSPRQLKSRLEHLQRPIVIESPSTTPPTVNQTNTTSSTNPINSLSSENKKRGCFERYCEIL